MIKSGDKNPCLSLNSSSFHLNKTAIDPIMRNPNRNKQSMNFWKLGAKGRNTPALVLKIAEVRANGMYT
jgi:hypothetical protein